MFFRLWQKAYLCLHPFSVVFETDFKITRIELSNNLRQISCSVNKKGTERQQANTVHDIEVCRQLVMTVCRTLSGIIRHDPDVNTRTEDDNPSLRNVV